MRIVEARSGAEIATVRALFEEYWESFGFTPCFQGFGEELARLPGSYAVIGLLISEDEPAGCVALRYLDAERAEFKRLYVRSRYRGLGCGRMLMEWVIGRARAAGCRELLADTMPQMETALAMYERVGFERTGPYGSNPTPGAVYLRMKL
jgi:putative acetyltransferase